MEDAQITRLEGLWGQSGSREERAEVTKREGGTSVLDSASLLAGRTGSQESLHSQVSLVSPTPTPWGSAVSLSNSSTNLGASLAPPTEVESVAVSGWARGAPSGTGTGEAPFSEGLGGLFGGPTIACNAELAQDSLGASKAGAYASYGFGVGAKGAIGPNALPTTYEESVPSYLLQDGHELKTHDPWSLEDSHDLWNESGGNRLQTAQVFSVPRLGDRWNPRPLLAPYQGTSRSGMAPLPPRRCASFAALSSDGSVPVAASLSANTAKLVLEELRQEKVILEGMKERVPRVWLLLCAEIHRVQEILRQYCSNTSSEEALSLSRSFPRGVPDNLGTSPVMAPSGNLNGSFHLSIPRSNSGSVYSESNAPGPVSYPTGDSQGHFSGLPPEISTKDTAEQLPLTRSAVIAGASTDGMISGGGLLITPGNKPLGRNIVKKRCRVSVPADQYPEYNFVGRLLGPRGATLKKLERETGCKIMIRGKGSIRKDKESEVRGKPGWEHVFSEPLHVILEAEIEESQADYALERAKELVELLLIPVPEDRDTLKREQLRELAILNGTLRSNQTASEAAVGAPVISSTTVTPSSDVSIGSVAGRRGRRSLSVAGNASTGSRTVGTGSVVAGSPQSNSEYRIFGLAGSLGSMNLSDMTG